MKNKVVLLILVFLISAHFLKAAENTSDNKNTFINEDKGRSIKLTNLELYNILFWSSYGAGGLTSLSFTFAVLGYSYGIAQDITKVTKVLKKYYLTAVFDNLPTTLPGIMFGINLLMAGASFIPVAGGIIYGGLCYFTAISQLVLYSVFNIEFMKNYIEVNEISSDDERAKLISDVDSILQRSFNPIGYFITGSFSILSGIAEIISFLFYQKELKRNKYPHMQKIFSAGPGFVSIKLDI